MKDIEVKENWHGKLKGVLMSIVAIVGGASGIILVNATTYFEVVKGAVGILIVLVVAGTYQLLSKKN